MKNTLVVAIVIIVLLIIGGLAYYAMQPSYTPQNSQNNSENNGQNNVVAPVEKSFTVDGQNFSFSLTEIKVNLGDKVKITFNNVSGFHNFVLDEFNVKMDPFQGPGTREVQFVADKTGTFEFYCSVNNHRQMGMKGKLIVE